VRDGTEKEIFKGHVLKIQRVTNKSMSKSITKSAMKSTASRKPGEGDSAVLKEHGLSVTQQRLRVLELLSKDHACLGVDDLVALAKRKKLDLGDWSTVFRTLKTFEEAGLVDAFLSADGVTRYERVSDGHAHHHHHFVCRDCRAVESLEECPTQVFEKAAKRIGFKVENHTLEVQGLCHDCQQKTR